MLSLYLISWIVCSRIRKDPLQRVYYIWGKRFSVSFNTGIIDVLISLLPWKKKPLHVVYLSMRSASVTLARSKVFSSISIFLVSGEPCFSESPFEKPAPLRQGAQR